MAIRLNSYTILQYRPTDTDSSGMAVAWQPLVRDFKGKSHPAEGLVNGEPAQFRLVEVNPAGVTPGPATLIEKVGISKSGFYIPRGTYDDPPDGANSRCLQHLVKNPDGSGWYDFDRWEETATPEAQDVDALQQWRATPEGVFYPERDRVLFSQVAEVAGVVYTDTAIYRALGDHFARTDDDAPVPNTNGHWEFVDFYGSQRVPVDTPPPDPPEPDVSDDNDIGIQVGHTL